MQTSKPPLHALIPDNPNPSETQSSPAESSFKNSTYIYPCRLVIPELLAEQSVLLLKQGAVLERVYLSDQLNPSVRIVKPGEVLFNSRLLYQQADHCTISVRAVHLHGTVVQCWPCEALLGEENGFAALQLCGWYGRALAACWQRMSQLVHHSAHYRLANLLIELAATFGVPRGEGRVILPLRLNVKELADCIGSKRETASIGLNRFKRHELVTFEGGLWVISPEALASYSEKL